MRQEILESRNPQHYFDLLRDLESILLHDSIEFRNSYYLLSDCERSRKMAFLAKLRERISVIIDALQLKIFFNYE